ncbi:MAG: hypothetical protein EKK63_01760 [Acinetobacter sp.]|uniref:hypothetical protein n=1 Tax=Acinetobacter sp. TaxID=472 RepID=UPI000FBAE71A|nr:hypothetical protein [Acinetobacter sp.]RUP42331.1 MAG: hypothetical protein EKK63_01760 [Acinetobacter sp.]
MLLDKFIENSFIKIFGEVLEIQARGKRSILLKKLDGTANVTISESLKVFRQEPRAQVFEYVGGGKYIYFVLRDSVPMVVNYVGFNTCEIAN